jgi:Enoyl-(Acyl carrier protein) reductase
MKDGMTRSGTLQSWSKGYKDNRSGQHMLDHPTNDRDSIGLHRNPGERINRMLDGKVGVIYGAGGSIGGGVARIFAYEGTNVFLARRTGATLNAVADDIRSHCSEGGTAVIDTLDEQAVDEFVDSVIEETGRHDVSFNLVPYGDVQEPLLEISADDFNPGA